MMKGIKPMSELPGVEEMAALMVAEVEQSPHKQKLYKPSKGGYKEQSDRHKGEQLAGHIRAGADTLKASLKAPKIELRDTNAAETRLFKYLDACELARIYPSVMGLASAFGITRQSLNEWLLRNPNHPTTDIVNRAKDVFADILTNASLYDNANPVSVIFQLKNHFSHADRIELAPVVQVQSDDDYDAAAIRARYLPDSDTDDT